MKVFVFILFIVTSLFVLSHPTKAEAYHYQGYVYYDINGNNTWDGGETGICNATVKLYDPINCTITTSGTYGVCTGDLLATVNTSCSDLGRFDADVTPSTFSTPAAYFIYSDNVSIVSQPVYLAPDSLYYIGLNRLPGAFSLIGSSTGCAGTNQPYVDLSWTSSPRAASYNVYRWNGSSYDPLGNTALTSWRDFPPNSSTQIYTAVAINSDGIRAPENTDLRPTPPTCPGATADIKCNGVDGTTTISNNTSATISWSSTDATSCSASGTGISSSATSNPGTSTGNLTNPPSSYTYSLSCSNGYSTSSTDSCFVSVNAPAATPTPIPASPPTVNSLTINGISATTGGTSGRISSQSGSDYNNPITINLNASAGSGSIRDFRVDFWVDFSPGFSIAYSPTSGGTCSSGNFCVLDGSWQNIIGGFKDIPAGCVPPSGCNYRVTTGSSDNSTFASWTVTFYANFTSKSMSTSATVTNTSGLSTTRSF